jgi:hypothetical protein
VSDTLTPTAQAILEQLRAGPAAATDLTERTGRSRSTIDKVLAELTRADLVTKQPSDQDGPTIWALTEPVTEPSDAMEPPDGADSDEPDPPNPSDPDAEPESQAEQESQVEAEVKTCRGCQAQMPTVCPTCQSKTTSYCGTCRQNMPTRRRGSAEPGILANGLPKLTPGELQRLVTDVMRAHPLPDHLGITGWTPSRIAVFLPGRSSGAIANALERLATTGHAELLGTDPKRYQPIRTEQPPPDEPAGDEPSGTGEDAQQ